MEFILGALLAFGGGICITAAFSYDSFSVAGHWILRSWWYLAYGFVNGVFLCAVLTFIVRDSQVGVVFGSSNFELPSPYITNAIGLALILIPFVRVNKIKKPEIVLSEQPSRKGLLAWVGQFHLTDVVRPIFIAYSPVAEFFQNRIGETVRGWCRERP